MSSGVTDRIIGKKTNSVRLFPFSFGWNDNGKGNDAFMKKKKDTSKTFKDLVDHIDSTWSKIKGYHYPFTGRDFKSLKSFTRSFQDWGVASLWDNFLKSDNDWVKKSGYSLDAFFKCLPWLVDTDWKSAAKRYEDKWLDLKPKEVLDLILEEDPFKNNFRNVVNEVRKEGLKREGLVS